MKNKSNVKSKDFDKNVKIIVRSYIKLKKEKKKVTMKRIIEDSGLSINSIKYYCGSIRNIDTLAREMFPSQFTDINVESILTQSYKDNLSEELSRYRRFFVTTAITGTDINNRFLNSIKNWEKENNGKMLVLVSSDPAHNLDKKHMGFLPKELKGEAVIAVDTKLNNNLFLSTIKLSAKQIDPITGMARFGQRNGSFIFASPKQRLKAVPVRNNKFPHLLMTTGAITAPHYSVSNFMSNRSAYIAENDHIMGGIIVEIVDNDKFHFRQVQADGNGCFIDLGYKYSSGSKTRVNADSIVIELHSGETDDAAKEALFEICDRLKPTNILVHDIFNGASINHHAEKDIIYKSDKKDLSLEKELKMVALDIEALSTHTDNVVIVKSNHDEWLNKYLRLAKYASDPMNHGISLILAHQMVNLGETDPLRWGVENIAKLNASCNVKWLSRDEDFIRAGVQLGAHGDKGANGSRGTLKSIENAYGDSITGHAHTPEILRGAWQIGTLTKLKLDYNDGPSSWLNSIAVLYPNGSRQLINIIDGEWLLTDEDFIG